MAAAEEDFDLNTKTTPQEFEASESPPEDNFYLVQELAEALEIPITSTYTDLDQRVMPRHQLNLNKFGLIRAFECLYGAATEEIDDNIAESYSKCYRWFLNRCGVLI
ncbi:hypothetical protein AgCh_023096 [Apium graveolens]